MGYSAHTKSRNDETDVETELRTKHRMTIVTVGIFSIGIMLRSHLQCAKAPVASNLERLNTNKKIGMIVLVFKFIS